MSIGPTSKYGLIIPKASYISSLIRQGTISREKPKRGFNGWIIITSMAMCDSHVAISEFLLRYFIGGRIVLTATILQRWSLNQAGHIKSQSLRRLLKPLIT
jgi:hypothetical protein